MHNFDNFIDLRLNRRRQNDDSLPLAQLHGYHDRDPDDLHADHDCRHRQKRQSGPRTDRAPKPRHKTFSRCWLRPAQDRDALKIVITNLEEKLRAQQMEIILLGDENKVVQSTLEAKVALISALQKQLSEIEADAEKLERRLTAAEAEKEALASRYEEQVKAISAETERQIEEFNRKFAALMDRLGEKEDLIVALNTERKDLELTLAKQRKAYLVLEDKYQRLIRPARSPLGKEVVTVQYSRQDGQYRILYKEPQSDGFEPVGREELQTRLDRLKGRWQDKLYIKIVIPEQSGLSYNEAWNFTRDILSRYDYYYQEKESPETTEMRE